MIFDNRLDKLGVKYAPNANATWTLASAVFQDETEAQGNHIILFTIQDEKGKQRVGVNCFVDWVGRDPGDVPTKAVTDATGQANVPIYANLDINKLNGPYFAYVENQSTSDVVTGMGLPEHQHVNFLLTFGPKVEKPEVAQTLEQAALAAAQSVPWMPVNNTAALWKFAQANGLQDQQTDEIPFTYQGEQYIAQVFNLGIVYVKVGDWGNVQVIRK
jgi:hypothetical protein